MILTQRLLNIQYEIEKKVNGLTSFAGMGLYFDLFKVLELPGHLRRDIGKQPGKQGYTDDVIVLTIILINLLGGDCVDDVERLESDEGIRKLFQKLVTKRYQSGKRLRRRTGRVFPSPSVIFRYLERFDDGTSGIKGKSELPSSIPMQDLFLTLNKRLANALSQHRSLRIATLDQDATLIETNKREALFGYKGYKAYQPLNVYWYELGLMLHTEFRPGNVNANFELLPSLKAALAALPDHVTAAHYRADGAGYNHELLKYLDTETGEDGDTVKKRFGRIRFCVGNPITEEFSRAVRCDQDLEWKHLDVNRDGQPEPYGREWAEVCFVPQSLCRSKKGREYRYLVTRQTFTDQRALPGMEDSQLLPFPTLELKGKRYKIFSVVTNGKGDGADLIRWHDQRCGRSEEVHAILKNDLAGGMMPSGKFGANAAWWWCAVLAHNLQAIFKQVALDEAWRYRRMKAFRFHIINLPGRIVYSGNVLTLRLAINKDKLLWLKEMRARLLEFARGPCLA